MTNNKNLSRRQIRKLNRLLKRTVPRERVHKSLRFVFLLITIASLLAILYFSIFEKCEKIINLGIAISSGLFASGLYATAVEFINYYNHNIDKENLLINLHFYCKNYFLFFGDGLNLNDSLDYNGWVDKFLESYNKKVFPPNQLFESLDQIRIACHVFSDKKAHEFNNPVITQQLINKISLLEIRTKNLISYLFKRELDENIVSKILKDEYPKLIISIFPDCAKEKDKKHEAENGQVINDL